MDAIAAIKGRRSVRKYKPDPVSQDAVEQILEAARWAPSWANTQCWEYIVIRDTHVKEKLAATVPESNPARPSMASAPVIIAVCANLGKAGCYKGRPVTDKGDWYMFDVALSMQNLVLSAYALGLGTVHVGFFDAPKAGEVLEVPEGVAVVEMTPLGYPAEDPSPPPRRDLAGFVHYDRFGKKTAP